MKYTVERIDEDMDFGCEERIEGAPVMAVVTLIDDDGQEIKLRQPDQNEVVWKQRKGNGSNHAVNR